MGRKAGMQPTVEEEMFAPAEHRTTVVQSSASNTPIHLETTCVTCASLESNNKRNNVFSCITAAQFS
jgi:hypothetical protein